MNNEKNYVDEVGLEKVLELLKDQIDSKTVTPITDEEIEDLFDDNEYDLEEIYDNIKG